MSLSTSSLESELSINIMGIVFEEIHLFNDYLLSTYSESGSVLSLSIEERTGENRISILKWEDFFFQGNKYIEASVQFSSVAQSCPTFCNPMNCSTPGLPVHYQFPEFTQIHLHRVGDVIQPLSSPSPAPNPSQYQGLFQ